MHVCSSFSANQFVSICIVLWTTLVYRSLIAFSFCKCYSYFGCNRFNLSIALCRFTFAIPFFFNTIGKIPLCINAFVAQATIVSVDFVDIKHWPFTFVFSLIDSLQSISFFDHDVVYHSFHSCAIAFGTNH